LQTDVLYGRKYRVLVTKKSGGTALDVSDLRCVFNIEKIMMAPANYAVIDIYNLSLDTENDIISQYDRVIVEAGFEGYYSSGDNKYYIANQYGVIFDGDIVQSIRSKEDNVDLVLTLVCLDGDQSLYNNLVSFTVAAGLNQRQIINKIASSALVPTEIGRVSPEISDVKLPRGKVVFGEPKKYLREIAKNNNASFYVDDGKIYVRHTADIAENAALVLSPENGLIGYPQQVEYGLSYRCLLNPLIKLGTMVKLEKAYIKQLEQRPGQYQIKLDEQGQYQTYKVSYLGDTRGNDWYTEVEGYSSTGKLLPYLQTPDKTGSRGIYLVTDYATPKERS
jgi:hypothetical protein